MLLKITLFFSCVFLIIEIKKRKYKTSKALSIIPLCLLFIIVAFNRMNNDYLAYLIAFQNNGSGFEIGFQYLIKTFKILNLQYEAIVFAIGLLLSYTVKKMMKYNANINLIIFLYCIFPLVYDINQIRNLIMYLIIIITLFSVQNRNKILYYIGVFLGVSFHTFALAYLPFYYLCGKNRKRYFEILFSAFFVMLISSSSVMKILLKIFPVKIGEYLAGGQPHLGIILVYSYVIIDVFTVWWINRKIKNKLDSEETIKMETLYRFVWYEIIILPFIPYFIEIQRFQRNGLLVKYYYCSLAMKYLKTKDKIMAIIMLTISAVIPVLVMIYTSQFYLFKYLDNNYILDCIK